jgi:amidase
MVFPASKVDKVVDVPPTEPYAPRNDADAWNWERYNSETMHGHPVGLQIIGRRFEEERVLGAAVVCDNLIKMAQLSKESVVRSHANFDWQELLQKPVTV